VRFPLKVLLRVAPFNGYRKIIGVKAVFSLKGEHGVRK
jgi:hypothetical protein